MAFLAVAVAAFTGQATEQFDQGPVFSVLEENDLVVRTDRHYTQGVKLSYLHSDGVMPGLMQCLDDCLPKLGFSERVARFGLQIGQNIYTPGDISTTALLPKDRPYAGWLYTGMMLQRRGFMSDRWPALESFELQLGVIGPESLAEEAQTWIHEIRNLDLPQGWRNQLKTEPGIELRYWRGVRLVPSEAMGENVDFIPHAGASLGNVTTTLRVGGTLRVGIRLPNTFGMQTISSLVSPEGGRSASETASRWSLHVFTDWEGWLVGHNAFLDGNLYQHSHEVSKETFVFEWKSGFAVDFKYAEVGFAYVYRSREFLRQQEDNGYGSLFVTAKF